MTSVKPESLKERVLRAGGWSLVGYGLSQAIRLGSALVMTRLLVPEMFGVMTIATMISVILSMLSDMGVRQCIVRSPRGDDPQFLDTAWTIGVARGAILWLLALLVSGALQLAMSVGAFSANSVYAAPELPLVIAISSISAVILGLESTKSATAYRKFDQRRLILIEIIAQTVSVALMILVALVHRSIWALVAGGLAASLMTMILSHAWLVGHSNRFRWEEKSVKEMGAFGKWIFASSAISVLASQGDRLLLGSFLSASDLGLYSIAMLIVRALDNAVQKLFVSVSLPTLSEIARNAPSRLSEIYYRLSLPTDLLLLFLAGLLFSSGHLLVNLLFDQRYAPAGGILEILSLSLVAVRYGVAEQIYLAVGLSRNFTIISIARCLAMYLLVPLLYFLAGTRAAVWGIAVHALVIVPLVYVFNVQLGVINVKRELIILSVLPLGYLCGLWMTVSFS